MTMVRISGIPTGDRFFLATGLEYAHMYAGEKPEPGRLFVARRFDAETPVAPEGWQRCAYGAPTHAGYHWQYIDGPAAALTAVGIYAGLPAVSLGFTPATVYGCPEHLLAHLGEYILEDRKFFPRVFQIQMVGEGVLWAPALVEVTQDIRWADSTHSYAARAATECRVQELVQHIELVGRSGIATRNNWVMTGFKTITVTAFTMLVTEYTEGDWRVYEWDESRPVEVPIVDPAVLSACLAIRQRMMEEDAATEWRRLTTGDGPAVIELREFNKSLARQVAPPEGIYIIDRRVSSLGNTSLVVVKIPRAYQRRPRLDLQCPSFLRGALLGRDEGHSRNRITELGQRLEIGRIQLV